MFSPQRFSGWQDSNDFGMMFVMAVRSGYQPDRAIAAIKGWKPEPNGIVSQKRGGGIETAGIVEAINNMLLQSHDGVVRLFPNWDRRHPAEFHRLRAVGAFLVDARWDSQASVVTGVRVLSEKGLPCCLESPFPEAAVRVIRETDGQEIPTLRSEEEFSFETAPGVAYRIERQQLPPAAPGAPVIQRQPQDVTVAPPAQASFAVTASGESVRYQWQKNRVDLPGATESIYTSPPITLWDYGSEYRCVLTNDSGTAISRAAVLNPGAARNMRWP
jgi:hypothetical protein